MRRRRLAVNVRLVFALSALIALVAPACGSTGKRSGFDATDGGEGERGGPDPNGGFDGDASACTGLACQVPSCAAGRTTTIRGTVRDPAGKVPLYNVVAYVPNAPLAPIAEGATCDRCGTISGAPIATALTDTRGQFELRGVPAGENIPLVLQVGKWRRQVVLPAIRACEDNDVTDPGLLRLPRNRSEGDMPKIALSTGGADPLECLLRKIGIDDAEFGTKGDAQRVHLFEGQNKAGASFTTGKAYAKAAELWRDADALKAYDLVLLSCEGAEESVVGADKGPAQRQGMLEYMNAGGRVFASHLHKFWLLRGPAPLPSVATFVEKPDLPNPTTAFIDTSFPKGAALSEWLVNVGGTPKAGEFSLRAGQHTVDAVNAPPSQRWIYGTSPSSVMYFTFNTPLDVAPEAQCGRVVFSDIHVSSGDATGRPFPSGCTTSDLSAQEKALEFMLFDLSSCVNPDDERPRPPR
jgi:hypothetical protein